MNPKESEKISIVVPAYQVEAYIRPCLESLLQQTYSNLEILVVDDGSTDSTWQIIQEYAKKDPRILAMQQENQGVSKARNRALRRASGDYVLFVDADDWLNLETCEKTITVAKEEQADVVMFGYVREYENHSLPKALFEEEKIVWKGEDVKEKLHRRIFGPIEEELAHPEKLNAIAPVCMKLYRMRFLRDLSFVDFKTLGTCEDGYFNISVFEKVQKVVFIKQYDYHYRKIIGNGSLTQKKDYHVLDRTKRFYQQLWNKIEAESLPEEYKVALNNRMVLSLIEMGITLMNTEKAGGPSEEGAYHYLKQILQDSTYRAAIQEFKIAYVPLPWKCFFWLAKRQITVGVYGLLKIIVMWMDKT